LLARLGRWASPDPLHVHASGGGEALNSYHYVGGNLLQARDPVGLDWSAWSDAGSDGNGGRMQGRTYTDDAGRSTEMEFRAAPAELTDTEFEHAIAGMSGGERARMREMRAAHDLTTDRGIGIGVSGTTAGPGGIPAGAGVGLIAGIVIPMMGIVCSYVGIWCVGAAGALGVESEADVAPVAAEIGVVVLTDGLLSAEAPATRALVAADGAAVETSAGAARAASAGAPRRGSAPGGAMPRRRFEADVSARRHAAVPRGRVSRGPHPARAQEILDEALYVDPGARPIGSDRMVGIDYEEGSFVVFDAHEPFAYHGHVVEEFAGLRPDAQAALRRSGLVDRRGHILPRTTD